MNLIEDKWIALTIEVSILLVMLWEFFLKKRLFNKTKHDEEVEREVSNREIALNNNNRIENLENDCLAIQESEKTIHETLNHHHVRLTALERDSKEDKLNDKEISVKVQAHGDRLTALETNYKNIVNTMDEIKEYQQKTVDKIEEYFKRGRA